MNKKELIKTHETELKNIHELIPMEFQRHPTDSAYKNLSRSVRELATAYCGKNPTDIDLNTVEMRLKGLGCPEHQWEYINSVWRYSHYYYYKRCKLCQKTVSIELAAYLRGSIDFHKVKVEKFAMKLAEYRAKCDEDSTDS